MVVEKQQNVKIINQDTGEVFYGDNPYVLMQELGKKYPGGHFTVETLRQTHLLGQRPRLLV